MTPAQQRHIHTHTQKINLVMAADCQFETLHQSHLQKDKQQSLKVINQKTVVAAQSSGT